MRILLRILVGKLIIYTIVCVCVRVYCVCVCVCVCVCMCVCVYALTAVLQFHRGVAPQLVRVAKQRVHIVSEQIIAVA